MDLNLAIGVVSGAALAGFAVLAVAQTARAERRCRCGDCEDRR